MGAMKRIFKGWAAFSLLLVTIAIVFTGCVTPTVTIKPEAKLNSYRKVYIFPPKQDPRGVYPRVVSRLKQSGFDVVEISPEGPLIDAQGTGFLVTPQGHVLTCAHVVGNQTNATVWINGVRLLCHVVAADTNLDLAVILVNGNHEMFHPLRFATNTNYQMGQDVYTMGFPLAEILGTAPRLNKGLISSTVGMEDNPAQLQVSAQVQPGNSGGPLLNERGEVLGVTVATLNPMRVLVQSGGNLPQNINFAIKTGPVLEFLKRANISLPADTGEASAAGFETAKTSLALVRNGDVSEEDLKQPAMVCACTYLSLWDMFYRFRAIQIDFYDVKKNERIFRVGQYRDAQFSSEDDTLNHLFAEISANFFADRPNPFQRRGSAPQGRERQAQPGNASQTPPANKQ